MNSSFHPLLVASNCDSPFNSPIRNVQPRWMRVQSFNSPSITATRRCLVEEAAVAPDKDNEPGDSSLCDEYTECLSDRFIPNRSSIDVDSSEYTLSQPNPTEGNGQPSCIVQEGNSKYRVLSFAMKPPEVKSSSIAQVYAQVQYPVPRKLGKGTAQERPYRSIPTAPFKVLDAPGILDDYYLNLLSWSAQNVLAVALGAEVYLWNATNGMVTSLDSGLAACEGIYYASLSWCADGSYLAVGTSDGNVQVWDGETNQKLRTMTGNKEQEMFRVGSCNWNSYMLSSGCRGGYILNHDTRLRNHIVQTFHGHEQEVCGLEWDPEGRLLCSGGNDNLVNIWDARKGDEALYSFSHHQAAVKAVGWCPFQSSILATGGGSTDKCIKFWNTATGTLVNSVDTGSQVCSLKWSKEHRELLSSHGYADNQLVLWKYPSMSNIARINAHSSRVLHLALSPDGQTIASAAGDETIKFWNMFENSRSSSSGHVYSTGTGPSYPSLETGGSSREDSAVYLGKYCSPLSKIVNESSYKKLKIR